MSYNKRFSLRLIVLDGLLRKKEGVSMKEILQVVNNDLELHGVCPVKSKETLLQDMIELGNSYHVVIVKFKDKSDHRIIRYRYENLSFSIFNSPLSDAEIKEIKGMLDVLSSFHGLPQCEWIAELCARFDVACEINGHKVVQFEECCVHLGMEYFTPIFHTILNKKAATITYQKFGCEEKKHLVYPYYLKQYGRRWYLIARSSKHLDTICIFSLDRISSFEEEPNSEYVPIDVDINEYFKDVCGITRPDNGTPITIRFYVNAELLPYLITNPIHQSQAILERKGNGAILAIHVIPTPELLRKFLSLGQDARIITSCAIRSELLKNCKDTVDFYSLST